MATTQIKLSKSIDKKLQYYMLNNNIKNKKAAIVQILKDKLKK